MTMSNTDYLNTLLVTRTDINNEVRPTSADEALVNRCIEEAQMLDIKPSIGDDVYMRLFNLDEDASAQLLWNGGVYQDCSGNNRIFAGLKKALLYYAYARLVRTQGGTSTRFDFVVKADQYSDSADLQAKVQAYNEAFSIADGYKVQALQYMASNPTAFGSCNKKIVNNRIAVKKIGY